jgi:hypothetical protein
MPIRLRWCALLACAALLSAPLCAALRPARPPRTEDILGNHRWTDRVPPVPPDDHNAYFFVLTGPMRTGVFISREDGQERREGFEWELAGGRLWFRFFDDDRRAVAFYKLYIEDGAYDYVLELETDPCRGGTRQVYYGTALGAR